MPAGTPRLLLAAKIGAGGLGLIVVLLLIIAAIAIFIAMSGSLKRLRQSVDKGVFEQPAEPTGSHEAIDSDPADTGDPTSESVSRDQAGPGGGAA